jgi:hypothetical protein
MIVFNLQCDFGHRFEGWFASHASFDDQLRRGLVECPVCESRHIEKLLSAPRINRGVAFERESDAQQRGSMINGSSGELRAEAAGYAGAKHSGGVFPGGMLPGGMDPGIMREGRSQSSAGRPGGKLPNGKLPSGVRPGGRPSKSMQAGARYAGDPGANDAFAHATPEQALAQAIWLSLARHVIENTEDVGSRFAEEARRIHYREAPDRGIRGQTTVEEAQMLAEEGIEVVSFPLPVAFKRPLQ